MGVVYKAEDTKLKRTVALKFLPPELTHIPDVKERFMREAQAAAALDHPHICTVYEFDEAEEKAFISMAYIEGQSLRKKIESGPLELDEALRIATQVGLLNKQEGKRSIFVQISGHWVWFCMRCSVVSCLSRGSRIKLWCIPS